MMKRSAATLLVGLMALACASSGNNTRRDPDVITFEELQSVRTMNAYDAIQRLRPAFLRRPAPSTLQPAAATGPVVRVDAAEVGGLEQLRTIPTEVVMRVEYISALDATTRWGTGHGAGVILVTTRK